MNRRARILAVGGAVPTALPARALERRGYAVASVDDAAGALRLLEREPADLVLLGGSAILEGLRLLRARHRPMALPVVVVMTHDDRRAIVAALGAGANDYLVPPADPEITLSRIERQLALRRENGQLAATSGVAPVAPQRVAIGADEALRCEERALQPGANLAAHDVDVGGARVTLLLPGRGSRSTPRRSLVNA